MKTLTTPPRPPNARDAPRDTMALARLPSDTFFRDVLFHADLSQWIDELGRKGALLFVAHPLGAGMFQPLDGKQRFRIQIGGLEPDAEIDDDWCRKWLWSAVGADEESPIDILTKRIWRVSARASSHFAPR